MSESTDKTTQRREGDADHLEVLEGIVQGRYGSPDALAHPKRLAEWPAVRPALIAAIKEIKEARLRGS